jgi:integrase
MSLLAECPRCHRKQAASNKLCGCGQDLVKAKRSQQVRYWIDYRLPGGKQRKEAVGFSIEEARDADGKRKGQKREHRIFDILPEAKMTFNQFAEWYKKLAEVKALSTYARVEGCLANFNAVYGDRVVTTILPMDLREYQAKRAAEGRKPATIDYELSTVKTMVNRARANRMVSAELVELFGATKRKLKKGSNARERTLSIEEYLRLTEAAPPYLRALLVIACNTGMRRGELLKLNWSHVDREKGFIRLPSEMTKEGKGKTIPINYHVEKALSTLPRALHHDRVFTYKGQPISVNLRRSLKTACKAAGILYGQKVEGGFRFHDIRGSFKTNMLRAGVDKAIRDTILGHALQGMDRYYLKLKDDDLKAAMEKFTTWFDAQAATVAQNVAQEAKKG